MDITQSKEPVAEHVDEKGSGPDYTNTKYLDREAAQATANEHSLTLWQALSTYKRATMWSVRKLNQLMPSNILTLYSARTTSIVLSMSPKFANQPPPPQKSSR